MGRGVRIWWCLWLVGCGVDGRFADGAPDGGSGEVTARGSAACRAWQRAFCDFGSDRCGILPRGLCDAQQQGVECADDDQAQACALDFLDAPCERPPAGCEVVDVADPVPAREACEMYFDALCASNVRCGMYESVSECRADPLFSFDCGAALSVDLRFEECLRALELRLCNEAVPACDTIIRSG